MDDKLSLAGLLPTIWAALVQRRALHAAALIIIHQHSAFECVRKS